MADVHVQSKDVHLKADVQMVPSSFLTYRKLYLSQCIPLHRAALKGDWKAAENMIKADHTLVKAHITQGKETALHIAAAAEHVFFVAKLVEKMNENDLELQNKRGNTALCFAAATGNVQIAQLMVKKNYRLPLIRNPKAKTPLYMAALLGHSDMVDYLFPLSQFESWTPEDQIELLNTCISSGLCGVALKIVERYTALAMAQDSNSETALHVLARKPSLFSGRNEKGLWRRIINSLVPCTKVKHNEKLIQTEALELLKCLWYDVIQQEDLEISDITGNISPLLFTAAELGNEVFLIELLRSYPDFVLQVNFDKQSIFHIAVLHRHEPIFNLIYEIGALKELMSTYRDDDDNNMLHLAARLAPPNQLNAISGAALQMQRQLVWYKEVEKIVQPSYRDMKNKNGQTPHDLFTMEHKELMKEGEKWMKDTAKSCMIVTTLIAIVVFISAFVIPGGNNAKGEPILLNERFFKVYSVSKVIAMLSSSTSILMFLSILTSRYAENDFLQSLPVCLMIGVTMLFLSVASMMISFCSTFILSYHHGLAMVSILFCLFACVPIVFISFNYSLLVDIVCSTFSSRFVFRSHERLL
ncbi:hypothetical protein F0562_025226 [Nyssa sinensis]|uniref:PGG domain-containing protein n=1 Tax=Nyssa sinensis TaxID=561372 RepID=A0A5J5BDU9_9ASTE|nr:hypothetical protein F0562_025226 [Nyssa sinensis]